MLTIEYLRSFRFGGYAIFDFTASFLGIYLLAPLLSKFFRLFRIAIPKQNWLFLTLPIGVLTHVIAGQFTPLTQNFLDPYSHYFLKLVLVGLFFLGLRNIKIIKTSSR